MGTINAGNEDVQDVGYYRRAMHIMVLCARGRVIMINCGLCDPVTGRNHGTVVILNI